MSSRIPVHQMIFLPSETKSSFITGTCQVGKTPEGKKLPNYLSIYDYNEETDEIIQTKTSNIEDEVRWIHTSSQITDSPRVLIVTRDPTNKCHASIWNIDQELTKISDICEFKADFPRAYFLTPDSSKIFIVKSEYLEYYALDNGGITKEQENSRIPTVITAATPFDENLILLATSSSFQMRDKRQPNERVFTKSDAHTGPIYDISCLSGKNKIYTGGIDGFVRQWDFRNIDDQKINPGIHLRISGNDKINPPALCINRISPNPINENIVLIGSSSPYVSIHKLSMDDKSCISYAPKTELQQKLAQDSVMWGDWSKYNPSLYVAVTHSGSILHNHLTHKDITT